MTLLALLSLGFFSVADEAPPEEPAYEVPQRAGYAAWEYGKYRKIRDELDELKAAEDKATLDELALAYDRANGLIEEVAAPAEPQRTVFATQPQRDNVTPELIDYGPILAELQLITERIQERMADEDEAISLLLMVA